MAIIRICDFCGKKEANIIRLPEWYQTDTMKDACSKCYKNINSQIIAVNKARAKQEVKEIPLMPEPCDES